MSNRFFCIVVGYNEIPFSRVMEEFEPLKDIMGNYRWGKTQSIGWQNQRITFMELLNNTIEGVTGKQSRFHVAATPHLGAYYLASFLQKRSVDTEIINFFNWDQETFKNLLQQGPGAVVLTTTYYLSITPITRMVQFIRSYNKEVPIIVGGPRIVHICLDFPEKGQDSLFAQMGANIYVNEKQGELTLSRICGELKRQNPSLEKIPNIIYTHDGENFQRIAAETENNDMDENSVDWSLFPAKDLVPMVNLRTARSCPFKCAFCRYHILGGEYNLLSLEKLDMELQYLHSRGVTHLMFIDDTFNIPINRFKAFCRSLIKNRYNFKWFAYFRCSQADEESVELASKSGCRGVFLGLESGTQEVLNAMNKAAKIENYYRGIRLLKEHGIIVCSSFIIGHPGENEQTARKTIEFIQATQPDYYSLQVYFHDPKAPIAQQSDLYRIEGKHYAWKHKNMDWQGASDIIDEALETITGCHLVPAPSFNLEAIAYLMSRGMSIDTIKGFTRIASEMLVKSLKNPNPDFSVQTQRLNELFCSR